MADGASALAGSLDNQDTFAKIKLSVGRTDAIEGQNVSIAIIKSGDSTPGFKS